MTIDQAISLQEIIWTISALLSIVGASGLVFYRIGNLIWAKSHHSPGCPEVRLAWIFVRNNTFLWLFALMLLGIGIRALVMPNSPTATFETIKGGWILVMISWVLTIGTLWELYDQWYIYRYNARLGTVRMEDIQLRGPGGPPAPRLPTPPADPDLPQRDP